MPHFQYFTIERLEKSKVKTQNGLKISRSPKANRAVPGTTNTPYVVKKWKKLPNTTGALCLCYQTTMRVDVIKNGTRYLRMTFGLAKISMLYLNYY